MTKRILFVDVSPVAGGAQRSLLTLIGGLDDAGFQPTLLTADRAPGGVAALAERRGLAVGRLDTGLWRKSLSGLWQAGRDCLREGAVLRTWLQKHPSDLLYANGLQSAAFTAVAAPRELPLVFHHRDARAPSAVLRPTARRAELIIAVSEFTRESLAAVLPPTTLAKVEVVHNGVEAPVAAEDPAAWRQRWHIGAEDPLVVLAADFVPWKNHALLLQAVAELRPQFPELRAIIAGRARDAAGHRYEATLRKLTAELELDECVLFTGHLKSVGSLFAAATVCVSAAEAEPFGRTVIEALAWGCPLVVVKGGGPEEITRGCSAVQQVDAEPSAVAAGIAAWLGSERPAELTAAAKAWADRFNPEQYTRQVAALLDDLLSGEHAHNAAADR